jgi:hypothetical protein
MREVGPEIEVKLSSVPRGEYLAPVQFSIPDLTSETSLCIISPDTPGGYTAFKHSLGEVL